MKIKDKIRPKISRTLDVLIPEDKWSEYADMLDREGKLTKKRQLEMLLILCQSVEQLETLIEDLYFQLENKPNETSKRAK